MDEIKLISKFMTGLLSKAIRMILKKNLSCDFGITVNSVNMAFTGSEVKLHLDIDGSLQKKDLEDLILKSLK